MYILSFCINFFINRAWEWPILFGYHRCSASCVPVWSGNSLMSTVSVHWPQFLYWGSCKHFSRIKWVRTSKSKNYHQPQRQKVKGVWNVRIVTNGSLHPSLLKHNGGWERAKMWSHFRFVDWETSLQIFLMLPHKQAFQLRLMLV